MRHFSLLIIFLTMLSFPAYAEDDACEMLFVQNATGMSFDGKQLTLKDAGKNLIWFCDRPVRSAGHLTREAFMQLVSEGENNFAENPPNAAVSIFGDKDDDVASVVVTLQEKPVLVGNDLVYGIKVVDGKLPASGGAVTMFIDPIGRPMSPTSVAGSHRRHVRRAVRH